MLEILFQKFVLRAIEGTRHGARPGGTHHPIDSAQRTIPQPSPVIVYQINDRIALGEIPPFQLLSRGRRIRVHGRVDGADSVGSPLDDAKGLDIVASAPPRENS